MTGFLFELPFFPEKKKGRNSYGKLPKRLLPAKVLSPFRRRTTLSSRNCQDRAAEFPLAPPVP